MYAEKQQALGANTKAPERDISPIQSEIRAANDALDLLHLRVHTLADRLTSVLIQRGHEAQIGGANPVPTPIKTVLGRDVETIAYRITDACEKLDDMLAGLHL